MESFGMIWLIIIIAVLAFSANFAYEKIRHNGYVEGSAAGYAQGYRDSEQAWSKSLAFMRVRYGYEPDGGMDPLEACKLYEHEKRA